MSYKKNSRGIYHTNVWDGTYHNGKKHYISLYSSKSSRDLEKKVFELKKRVYDRNFLKTSTVSFQAYARQWEALYKSDRQPGTRAMYQNIIEKHFGALLCPVGDINRGAYIKMLNDITGARTRQQAQMVFKQVLKAAVRDHLVSPALYDDILGDAKPVKYKANEKRPLTDNERAALAAANFSTDERAFIYLLYGCGIRRGEALALTVADVDFNTLSLNIDKAVAFKKNDPYLKDTKNYKHRVVPLPDFIVPALKAHIDNLSRDKLFAMQSGGYITQSAYVKLWRRLIRKLNAVAAEPITDLTAHIFRHNYCTMLCYQVPAISINDIAYLMGDTKNVVLNVYDHLMAEKLQPAPVVSSALRLTPPANKNNTKITRKYSKYSKYGTKSSPQAKHKKA